MKTSHNTLQRQASPFDEGWDACSRGAHLSANPYASRTDEHLCWHAGWLDLHAHVTSRDAALEGLW